MGCCGSKSGDIPGGESPAAPDGGSGEPHVEDGGSEAREAAAVIDAIDLDQRSPSKLHRNPLQAHST